MTTVSKAIPPISAESIQIRARLRQLQVEEIVTIEQLSAAVGSDLTDREGSIRSAIRAIEKEGVVIHRIRKVGWKRATPSEIISGESAVPSQIHRKTKRSLRRLSTVDFDKLTNEEKIRHSTVAAQVGAIALFANSKATDRIEAAVIGNGSKPDHTKVIELFKQ